MGKNRNVMKGSQPSKSQISNMIMRAIDRRAEHKYIDTVVGVNVGTGWNINAITQGIVQGLLGSMRIGDNIRLLRVTMNARYDVGAGTATDIRVVLVLDKMNVGVAPVYTDLFVNTNITSAYSVQQIKEKRFTILYDKLSFVNNVGRNSLIIQKSIPLNHLVEYNATAGSAGDNGKNSMWLFLLSTDNTNKPGFNSDLQVEYTDI